MTCTDIARLILVTIGLLLIQGVCLAQSNYASLSGTIFDPQRQAVPGASVQVTSVGTRAVRQVTSNDQGLYKDPICASGSRSTNDLRCHLTGTFAHRHGERSK